MSLVISSVGKNYSSLKALKGIDLTLNKGEVTGILGANGAGKTTLIKVLAGYFYPSEGSVLLNDVDLAGAPGEYRSFVGLLPEGAPLPLDCTLKQLMGEYDDDKVQELLTLFEIDDVYNRPIKKLSRGYRQRIGLALAVVNDPALLLLDEPFSGLDPSLVKTLRHYLRQIGKEKIILFSSHILQEVYALCDRILILQSGVLKGDYPRSQLSGWEELDDLYSRISRGERHESS